MNLSGSNIKGVRFALFFNPPHPLNPASFSA